MKKRLFLLISIVFSLVLAATAQSSDQTQTPPVTSTTPATQIGSGAQNKAGAPAPSATRPNSQANPAQTTPAAPAAGAAQPASPEASEAGIAAPNDPELESQIQNALNKEPTLTGNTTHVTVSSDAIELSGNVSTSKEKITATRIVQSYAGSKKVMNHLTIGGKGEPQQQESPDASHSGTNPESNKGSQPPASQPPRN